MNKVVRSVLQGVLIGAGLWLIFFAGFYFHAYGPASITERLAPRRDFPLLYQVYGLIQDRGLKPMPAAPGMEYGMIKGMIQAYNDPYTSFVEPVQTELQENALSGKFGGIGARLGNDPEGRIVLYPFPDSPAAKAGVLEGDRLVAVGDLKIDPTVSTDKTTAALRGPVGEKVTITIARPPDFAAQQISIVRAEIALPSTTWHIEPSDARLGVIEVNLIAATTPDEIQKAAKDLQGRGATALVLDLRNNGGGLLDAGINTARLFLKDGDVIQQQFRGQDVVTYQVEKPGPLVDVPLVVLVNENTASAAEIISGALQAHKRATLIGAVTYGKNTIQLVFPLQDGSSLHITAAHWWIPGIEFPKDGKGLRPDISLSNPGDNPIPLAIKALFNK